MKIKIKNALGISSAKFNVDGITVVSRTSGVLNSILKPLLAYYRFVVTGTVPSYSSNGIVGAVSIIENNVSIRTVFDINKPTYHNAENIELAHNLFINVPEGDFINYNPYNRGYIFDKDNQTKVSPELLGSYTNLKGALYNPNLFIVNLMDFVFNPARSEFATVVISQPDSGLHPDYHLLLAEFIVLLQKEGNVRFIIDTFSPYLINALEVYSVKYGVPRNFVQGNINSKGVVFEDLGSSSEKLFDDLVRPLQTLENIEWSLKDNN